MRHALIICAKDLRQRARDRTAIIVGFVMPLVLAGVIGSAVGGSGDGFEMRIAVVTADRSTLGPRLDVFLDRPWLRELISLSTLDDEDAARRALRDDRIDAAFVVPEQGAQLRVLSLGDNALSMQMAEALAREFVASVRGSAVHHSDEALPSKTVGGLVARSPGARLRLLDYFCASMAVLFLNFAVLFGIQALQMEKDAGTFRRLAASPASAASILAGKYGAFLLMGAVQMCVMIVATSVIFGTRWGDPLAVAALVLTTVLTSVGMISFFVTVVDDAEKGRGLAIVAILVLAILSGQFLPPGMPDVFDTLARLTPNGQALRGFTDLIAAGDRGGLHTVIEPLLVTLGVGVAGIAYGARAARRNLEAKTR